MKELYKKLGVIFIILLGICLWIGLLVAIPLLVIWSVNTLFGLGIAYNLGTWAASTILINLFSASIANRMVNNFSK